MKIKRKESILNINRKSICDMGHSMEIVSNLVLFKIYFILIFLVDNRYQNHASYRKSNMFLLFPLMGAVNHELTTKT